MNLDCVVWAASVDRPRQTLRSIHRALLAVLAVEADFENQVCMTAEDLADEAWTTEATVKKALHELVDVGLLNLIGRRSVPNGKRGRDPLVPIYRLCTEVGTIGDGGGR